MSIGQQLGELPSPQNEKIEATQENVAALVIAHHEELATLLTVLPSLKIEATQENLAALVIAHHEELATLLTILPSLKKETLDFIDEQLGAKVANVLREIQSRPDYVLRSKEFAKVAVADVTSEGLAKLNTIVANAEYARDQIAALTASLDADRKKTLAELTEKVTAQTNRIALGMLQSEDAKERIRSVFAEHSKPLLAAFEAGRLTLANLFQGAFIVGKSKAKRGEIWTWRGSSYLCLGDTEKAPNPRDPEWAVLASRGGSVAGGGGTQGSESILQWIDYASHWDTAPTEVSAGVLSYTWLGVTRYRNVPDPYVASSDAFYSDAGLTNLIIARGQ